MTGKKPSVMVIIPARGGSKSIPGKNIKSLGGHPLISYSIAAGIQASYVDRVIVSTDDEEIASHARYYGAEVPFMRPARLAEDHVTDLPVFEHALLFLEKISGTVPDIVVQLRPTSPFRAPGCIDAAVNLLAQNQHADSVRGVTESMYTPYKMWRIRESRMEPLLDTPYDEPYNMPRQQLPKIFWQTGQIEAIRSRTIIEKKSMTGTVILPYVLDPACAVDLDTKLDWQYAEFLLERGSLNIVRPSKKPPA